jgi:spermidine synthase
LANLLATFVAQDTDLAPCLADAEINTDRTLRLQYLAGLGLNRDRGNVIYHELRRYRSLPPRLFTGSPENLDILKRDLSQ